MSYNLIFQRMKSVRSNNLSLKYQRFITPSGSKDKGIRNVQGLILFLCKKSYFRLKTDFFRLKKSLSWFFQRANIFKIKFTCSRNNFFLNNLCNFLNNVFLNTRRRNLKVGVNGLSMYGVWMILTHSEKTQAVGFRREGGGGADINFSGILEFKRVFIFNFKHILSRT